MDAHISSKEFSELKDAILKMAEKSAESEKLAPIQVQPVTTSINNPLVWISFGGFLIVILASLVFSIYEGDKEELMSKTNINSVAIKDLSQTIEQNQKITIQLQSNQERMLSALEQNNLRTEKALDRLETIDRDRFNNQDGSNLKDSVKGMIDDFQKDIRDELTQVKTDIRNMRDDINSLKMLDTQFKQTTQTMNDINARVRALETKER